jgi:predicted RNase H-like HicB family nuclease
MVRPEAIEGIDYAVFIKWAGGGCSASTPDLPGCVAPGATVKETEREIAEAIRFHVDGLKEDGLQASETRRRHKASN